MLQVTYSHDHSQQTSKQPQLSKESANAPITFSERLLENMNHGGTLCRAFFSIEFPSFRSSMDLSRFTNCGLEAYGAYMQLGDGRGCVGVVITSGMYPG